MLRDQESLESDEADVANEYDIAIVGLAGRFPGANTIDEYWNNLEQGIESITQFSEKELLEAGLPEDLVLDSNYVRAAPVISDAARFDASLFSYSPREAKTIDPQQRHVLELCWAAMDNAGYDPRRYDGKISTFAGTALNTYFLQTGLASEITRDYLPTLLGSDKDFLATRVAYKLGLTGPAVTVQTACSTSLVALHLACQSLLSQESDMALVAAAVVRAPLAVGHLYEDGSVFSPDGHCKPFDAAANGTIFGSGAGVVLVKRLADALEDNDHIWAVVKGSAINNDGMSKADFTAPSINMQAEVITEALASADIDAGSISYVEAHGTGTYHGDPIEVEALTRAFAADTDKNSYCGIGSVKSNIGHLDAAAGLASLIKVALALKHRKIPPTLHYTKANSQIDFENSPFRVISELETWQQPNGGEPRRAGITSLGMGGTNAHVVVEEAPAFSRSEVTNTVSSREEILVFSAQSSSALDASMNAFAEHVQQNPDVCLSDASYTLQYGRQELTKRKALIAKSAAEAAEAIVKKDASKIVNIRADAAPREIVLMFPGQGAQYPGMGADLYQTEAVYKNTIDACADLLKPELELDLRHVLYPELGVDAKDAGKELEQTWLTQPAIFATEYAYAMLLRSHGFEPVAMIGHSIGEYTAATIAGVFALETAVQLVATRGRLMQNAATGSMLAVNLAESEIRTRLRGDLSVAVVNSVDMTVVAGSDEEVEALKEELKNEHIGSTVLKTSHAFHSNMMREAADEFEQVIRKHTLSEPSIRFVSNVTGDWITNNQAMNPEYWASHIRNTVKFSDGLHTLFELPPSVFVETGPGTTLSSFAQQNPNRGKSHVVVSCSRSNKSKASDCAAYSSAIGALWAAGVTTDWERVREKGGRRIPLPGYQFQGEEHWFQSKRAIQDAADSSAITQTSVTASREASLDNWFWTESYHALPLLTTQLSNNEQSTVLLVGDDNKLSTELHQCLSNAGHVVHSKLQSYSTKTSATTKEDYQDLLKGIDTAEKRPNKVVIVVPESMDRGAGNHYFLELLHIAQALSMWDGVHSCELCVVTSGSLDPLLSNEGQPYAAMLIATIETIGKEMTHLSPRLIDVDGAKVQPNEQPIVHLAKEIMHPSGTVVAFRNENLWVRQLSKLKVPEATQTEDAEATFVIVGGFGDIGSALSESLARPGVKLGLISRKSLPERAQWQKSDIDDAIKPYVEQMMRLEEKGATVTSIQCSLDEPKTLSSKLKKFSDEFGEPNYVFHLGGIVDDAPILLKTDDSTQSVMSMKTAGTDYLWQAIESFSKTKLVLFSSISAYTAPQGKIDYATANAYQNAFTKTQKGIISVSWPGWIGTGMVKAVADPTEQSLVRQTGVEEKDGLQCLQRILNSGIRSCVVSPVDLRLLAGSEAIQVAATTIAAVKNSQTELGTGEIIENAGSSLKDRVLKHWCDLLGFEAGDVEDTDNFFELGGTSLIAVKLVARLEREFDVSLPLQLLVTAPTTAQIVEEVTHKIPKEVTDQQVVASTEIATERTNPIIDNASCLVPLTPLKTGDTRDNVFLLPGHGGTLMLYRQLAEKLANNWQVWGLQSVGLDGDAEPIGTFEEMGRRYIDEIKELQDKGPYYLAGNCGGGPLAWEVAHQLKSNGDEIGFVAMLASPHKNYPTYPESTSLLKKKLGLYLDKLNAVRMLDSKEEPKWRFIGRRILNSIFVTAKTVHIRDMEQYSDKLRAAGNQALYDVQQKNREAFYAYQPPAADFPIVIYSGIHQPFGAVEDPTLGYRDLIKGWLRCVVLEASFHNDFVHWDLAAVAKDMTMTKAGSTRDGTYNLGSGEQDDSRLDASAPPGLS